MGLVVPRHVGSSWTRALTRVPCIGRQILNPFATREAPVQLTLEQQRFELHWATYTGIVFSVITTVLQNPWLVELAELERRIQRDNYKFMRGFSTLQKVSTPNACVVQGSTVHTSMSIFTSESVCLY